MTTNPITTLAPWLPMPLSGDGQITYNSSSLGRIRPLQIRADSALFPRVVLLLGIHLQPKPSDRILVDGPNMADYSLTGFYGEVRLSERGDLLSRILPVSHRSALPVPASATYEAQVEFAIELDYLRLEELERRRAGGILHLWLELSCFGVVGGHLIQPHVPAFRITVSHEDWLTVYGALTSTRFEVLEIGYSVQEAKIFEKAVARLQTARQALPTGDYKKVVGLCREVLDTLKRDNDLPRNAKLGSLFKGRTDERSASQYDAIALGLTRLTNAAHHPDEPDVEFQRAEAQFAIRVTEALTAFLGSLLRTNHAKE